MHFFQIIFLLATFNGITQALPGMSTSDLDQQYQQLKAQYDGTVKSDERQAFQTFSQQVEDQLNQARENNDFKAIRYWTRVKDEKYYEISEEDRFKHFVKGTRFDKESLQLFRESVFKAWKKAKMKSLKTKATNQDKKDFNFWDDIIRDIHTMNGADLKIYLVNKLEEIRRMPTKTRGPDVTHRARAA